MDPIIFCCDCPDCEEPIEVELQAGTENTIVCEDCHFKFFVTVPELQIR